MVERRPRGGWPWARAAAPLILWSLALDSVFTLFPLGPVIAIPDLLRRAYQ